jgi:hypothetical protein
MQSSSKEAEKRRQNRTRAVLPIRVRGSDASGKSFEGLAHTLDITRTGARVAAIRHALKVGDQITLTYRQRKIEFLVIWTKQVQGTGEYHVGVRTIAQDADAWGMNSSEAKVSGRERTAVALAGAPA